MDSDQLGKTRTINKPWGRCRVIAQDDFAELIEISVRQGGYPALFIGYLVCHGRLGRANALNGFDRSHGRDGRGTQKKHSAFWGYV